MEQKKTPRADVEQWRATGFLLGLIAVLSVFYVALEWNAAAAPDDVSALDLEELMHESELVPMSNEETMAQLEQPRQQQEHAEQLRIVADDAPQDDSDSEEPDATGADDETLLQQLEQENPDKALAPLDVDPNNPLNFQVVEDLPQYPGGAVELMKWLTKTLRYPAMARARKVQGQVVAVFYVEKDGSVTGISITRPLSPECDREVLRVLRLMPNWQPGIQNGKPCRTKVCIPVVFKL